jgi:hypothetical protein
LQANSNSFPPEALGLREGGHATGVGGRVYSKNHKGRVHQFKNCNYSGTHSAAYKMLFFCLKIECLNSSKNFKAVLQKKNKTEPVDSIFDLTLVLWVMKMMVSA